MLKRIVLAFTMLAALAASIQPAQAAVTPHLYYPQAPHSLTLCGKHDHTPVGVPLGAYQVRNTFWRGTGPTCIVTPADGHAGFKVTHTPTPSTDVTTYPSVFRGCIWDMCTKNTPLPAQASNLRTIASSWQTRSTHPVTVSVRRNIKYVRVGQCIPRTKTTVTTRHRHVRRNRSVYYTRTSTTTCLVHAVRNENLPGTWNTAYDLWFGKHRMTQGHADGAELMVWLNHVGGCCRRAAHPPTFWVSGIQWELDEWKTCDRAWNMCWPLIMFRSVQPRRSVTNLNLLAFVHISEKRGLVKPSWWLENLNAGFEIWRGGVGLTTANFSAVVR